DRKQYGGKERNEGPADAEELRAASQTEEDPRCRGENGKEDDIEERRRGAVDVGKVVDRSSRSSHEETEVVPDRVPLDGNVTKGVGDERILGRHLDLGIDRDQDRTHDPIWNRVSQGSEP